MWRSWRRRGDSSICYNNGFLGGIIGIHLVLTRNYVCMAQFLSNGFFGKFIRVYLIIARMNWDTEGSDLFSGLLFRVIFAFRELPD